MRSIASLASLPDLSSAPEHRLIERRSDLLDAIAELVTASIKVDVELRTREEARQYAADAAADAASAIHD